MRCGKSVNLWGSSLLGFAVAALLLIPAVSLAAEDDFTQLPNVPGNSASSDTATPAEDDAASENSTPDRTGTGETDSAREGYPEAENSSGAEGTVPPTGMDKQLAVTGAYESTLYSMILVGSGGLLLSFGAGTAHNRVELEV